MPNTPKGLTYPSSSSPVAVPADLQELATDVDGLIVPNTGGTYTGSVSFTQSPSVPTPTSSLHVVNKTYADTINADVTALETELGTNPSGTFSTVVQRLDSYTDGFNKVGNLLTANQAAGTSGWNAIGATLSYSPLTITSHTDSNTSKGVYIDPLTFPATPGEMVTLTADVTMSAGAISAGGRFSFWTSGGVQVGGLVGSPQGISASGRLAFSWLVPATAAYVKPYFYMGSTALTGETVSFTNISLHRGAGGLGVAPGTPIVGGSHIATNGAVHLSGTGTPEGVVTAAPGSTWLQTDATTDVKGWIRWIKATGTANTGWVAGPEADTGWRNVTASLDATFKTNNANATLLVRRIGDRVEWMLNEAVAGSTTGTATLWTTVPSGFRPRSSPGIAAVACLDPNNGLPISQSLYINASTMYGFGWTAVRHYALLAYSTSDPWPSSLPGSAA